MLVLALIFVFIRIFWFLKSYSPFTLTFSLDSIGEIQEYTRKLPRLSLVILSDKHYIASYRLSTQPEFRHAFLKPDMNPTEFCLLDMESDLPKARVQRKKFLPETKVLQVSALRRSGNGSGRSGNASVKNGDDNLNNNTDIDLRAQINIVESFTVDEELDISLLFPSMKSKPRSNSGAAENTNGHGTEYCQECDNVTPAVEHCLQCNADVCFAHKEVHKYSKSYAKHEFIPLVVYF